MYVELLFLLVLKVNARVYRESRINDGRLLEWGDWIEMDVTKGAWYTSQ